MSRKLEDELAGNAPVMCTLSGAELREREASLLARFKSGIIAVEELGDGYAFRVPGDKEWFLFVSELMAAERECCKFLTFELRADPQMGPLTVRITGPQGTKEFLKSTFFG
jgi:hypothetical protein